MKIFGRVDKEKVCKLAEILRKAYGYVFAAMIWPFFVTVPYLPSFWGDLVSFFSGVTGFYELSFRAKIFLIMIAGIVFGTFMYFLGRKLEEKFICWE